MTDILPVVLQIQLQSDSFAEEAGVRNQANTSFVTVAAAWAGLRFLLLVQYIMGELERFFLCCLET
jgi:hypothetical protein